MHADAHAPGPGLRALSARLPSVTGAGERTLGRAVLADARGRGRGLLEVARLLHRRAVGWSGLG